MSEGHEGVVEIEQVTKRQVNRYLEAGYTLLYIDTAARASKLSDGRPFVQRSIYYVMGRRRDVGHIDYQPYEPKEEPHEAS